MAVLVATVEVDVEVFSAVVGVLHLFFFVVVDVPEIVVAAINANRGQQRRQHSNGWFEKGIK